MFLDRALTFLSIRSSCSYQPLNLQHNIRRPLTRRRLLLLTCPFVGTQVFWVIQQAFGIPHLLTLGFTNSETTFLLLAGPVSGLVIPVILAIVGDGSRKFSIICGGLGVTMSLLSLAWAQELSSLLMLVFGIRSEGQTVSGAKIVAVCAAYTLNAAMQPLHISLRALLMDICPPEQQATASLWIMRLSAIGSVLITSIAFFSSPSFKFLSAVCCIALSLLLALHTLEARYYYHTTEDRQSAKMESRMIGFFVSRLRQLFSKATQLPRITHRVCRTQLFSWFGWFPALFYMGSVVSQSYTLNAAKYGGAAQIDEAKTASTRTVLVFHCVILVTTIASQALSKARSKPAYSYTEEGSFSVADDSCIKECVMQLFRAWSSVLLISTVAFAAVSLLSGINGAAAVIIASLGACFAVSNWVPYALLGIDLAIQTRSANTGEEIEWSLDGPRACDELDGATAILTIHNVSICLPQIASALVYMLFFGLVEKGGWRVDVSWVFLIASPALLAAACDWETWRRS